MKSLILYLSLATKVIAFEQIFAINSGGEAHTDSDGIHYRKHVSTNRAAISGVKLDLRNVPESDRNIYRFYDLSSSTDQHIKYDIPVKSDGLYLMIAKFVSFWDSRTMDVTLNNEINLLSNVDLLQMCGGFAKTCDEYFYICVTDNILYYKNQSSRIQNGEIHVEIRRVKENARAAGLVLLKGTLGERQKLRSSASNEFLDFDPSTISTSCSLSSARTNQINQDHRRNPKKYEEKVDISGGGSMENTCAPSRSSLESIQEANNHTLAAVEKLLNQQTENSNQLLNRMDQFCDTSLKKLTGQLKQQVIESQAEMKSSIKRIGQTNDQILMQQSQSTGQMDIKIEKLQTELTSKSNQANKNVQTLQADIQQLVEIQRRCDKKTMEVQADTKTSIERIHESTEKFSTQQMQKMDSEFEKLESKLTTKLNQANDNIQALKTDVQKLVAADQPGSDKVPLEFPVELGSLEAVILDISKKLNEVHNEVLTMAENAH